MTKEVTIKKEVITKTIGKKKTSSKKVARKRHTRKKAAKRRAPSRSEKTEMMLVENFVALQKVMSNFSTNFENLSNQISDLLYLFEESAKTVVKKDFINNDERRESKELTTKLDALLNQNKLIAKGLTLMHETAENPKVEYSIGSRPKTEIIAQTKEIPIPEKMTESLGYPQTPTAIPQNQTSPINSKIRVIENPENKPFESF